MLFVVFLLIIGRQFFIDNINFVCEIIWTEAARCDDCVTPPETCDADLDNSGEVNIDDLLLLIGAWGVCP